MEDHDGSNRNVCNKHGLCNGVDKSIQYGVDMHNKLPVQYRCKLFTALSLPRQSSQSVAYGIANGVHDAAIKRDEVSTVGMQSVTDNQLQYWSHIDDYMEMGELDDLCGNDRTDVNCDNSHYNTNDETMDNDSAMSHNLICNEVAIEGDGSATADNAVIAPTSIVSEGNSTTFVLPTGNTFVHSIFSKEEHLLIQFGQVCTEANAPLYLVDELVKVLREEND